MTVDEAIIFFAAEASILKPLQLLQKIGLEWAFRIGTDPVRLFPRYTKNAFFLFSLIVRDLVPRRDRPGGPLAMEKE